MPTAWPCAECCGTHRTEKEQSLRFVCLLVTLSVLCLRLCVGFLPSWVTDTPVLACVGAVCCLYFLLGSFFLGIRRFSPRPWVPESRFDVGFETFVLPSSAKLGLVTSGRRLSVECGYPPKVRVRGACAYPRRVLRTFSDFFLCTSRAPRLPRVLKVPRNISVRRVCVHGISVIRCHGFITSGMPRSR